MFSEAKSPMRLSSRSDLDRSFSFRATSWSFAATLHTLLTFLTFLFFISRCSATWVAPLESKSCSLISLRPIATEVQLGIFLRWIALLAPTFWLLVVPPLNDRWFCSLRCRIQYPTSYSIDLLIYHLQLMLLLWQELFDFTAHRAALSSDILNSNGWGMPKKWFPKTIVF